MKSCKIRLQIINPKSVYTTREILSYEPDRFGIYYNDEQHLIKNLAMFDFESICVST